MDFKMYEYTHAVVGRLCPESGTGGGGDVDYAEARRQHDSLLRVLRELNVEVVEVDIRGSLREKLLLEDVAVVCHGIALLPTPTPTPAPAPSYQGTNVHTLRSVLEGELGQTVIEANDPDARLCGSDVLFTGREFFVGTCGTTNEAGAALVAEAFPEFPCTPIKMPEGARGHLRRYVSVAGPEVLCASGGREARELLRRMEREATLPYRTLTVPEDEAADCLYVNGTLVHRAIEEIPEGFKVFCEKIDFARRSICFSEPPKVGAALGSCCLLARKP